MAYLVVERDMTQTAIFQNPTPLMHRTNIQNYIISPIQPEISFKNLDGLRFSNHLISHFILFPVLAEFLACSNYCLIIESNIKYYYLLLFYKYYFSTN